ncbi:hypothetical protein GUJ93_ZPchr0007g5141 [Zizania palustris]|uniref:DUF4408 domain-containing protein n=1 Tax=Zizania palustris TaxID=103762 RepID=A0A8J5SIX6_ZIZPA|nr:hypothetical protein GUJ93_ZPchr0007g5141 [Zizania palustris]
MAAAAEDAGRQAAAAARLRFAWRVVRVAEVSALVVLLSRFLPLLPVAAGAASSVIRVVASLLLHPYSIFVIANGIVVLLLVLSRRDDVSSSSSSGRDDGDGEHGQFLSFAAAGAPLAPLPPIMEAEAAAAPPSPEEGAVFEDKQAVHVTSRAPRRSRSEKVGRGRRTRAASPELRRSESERARRRRSLSSASPADWRVANDEGEDEEFRKAVESFIAKQQTRFHREERFVLVAGAGAGDEITEAAAVK